MQDRYNEGKPQLRYMFCFPGAWEMLARVLEQGEKKYSIYNFMKRAPASELFDSMMRHLNAWWNGEDDAPETGISHLACAMFNMTQLCESIQNPPEGERTDDRPHRVLGDREDTQKPTQAVSEPPVTSEEDDGWADGYLGWQRRRNEEVMKKLKKYFDENGFFRGFPIDQPEPGEYNELRDWHQKQQDIGNAPKVTCCNEVQVDMTPSACWVDENGISYVDMSHCGG